MDSICFPSFRTFLSFSDPFIINVIGMTKYFYRSNSHKQGKKKLKDELRRGAAILNPCKYLNNSTAIKKRVKKM